MTRQLLEQGHPLQVSGRAAAQVEIVVPVMDEERDLGPSVRRLDAFLSAGFPFTARITIADNGSTDGTWATACALAGELPRVHATRLAQRAGLRIHEVPVDWTDDTDSRVRLFPTIAADLRGIARLGAGLGLGTITVPRLGREPGTAALHRQLAGFVAVGAACTAGYVA